MKKKELVIYNPGDPRPPSRTNWEKLAAMTDEDIDRLTADDPDDFPITEEMWKNARVIMPDGRPKQSITMRVSPHVLDFFKKENERGYQSRMNAVLEAYVQAHEEGDEKRA